MEKTTAKFTASARTVEMLGRQQIAGIPNAISELFKNAYDAYADRVVVDHYIPQRLMTLRDNGLGMTREDVERRWLVLGTDSKAVGRSAGLAEVAEKLGLELRNTVGEKGIGRLAIAVIGPQVLLLSRAKRPDESHGPVAAFVNWSLFELPGVSLDEIEVPIREFDDGVMPDGAVVADMVEQVRQNLGKLEEPARQTDGKGDQQSAGCVRCQSCGISIAIRRIRSTRGRARDPILYPSRRRSLA